MDDNNIPEGIDYKIRPATPEEKERLDNAQDIPEYSIKLKLSEEQKKRLTDQFFMEFEALEREREELKLSEKWKEADNQYDGVMAENKNLIFNLHVPQSKIKVDAITRAIKEAFLDSEPMIDVSPRPEMARKDGQVIADKQAEFIDYAMDEEVKPEAEFGKAIISAVKKFVGIIKVNWAYERETRKREESYEGKNVVVGMVNGEPVLDNEGLRQFLNTYPDGAEKHKSLIAKLIAEKKVSIVVNYKDTIYNNPKVKHIRVEDFYVRNATNYWEGLRTEHCMAEAQKYSYWELLKKEKNEQFENVEAIWGGDSDKGAEPGAAKDYMTREYDILEGTTYFKMNENDDEEVKIKAWFCKEKKTFHGAILFPYYALDTDYIPFYVKLNEYGFYGNCLSVMSDLRDSNLAQNALMNIVLHGLYIRNKITPIVQEGTEVEAMFLENRFIEGAPISIDGTMSDDWRKQFGFVDWPAMNVQDTVLLKSLLQRQDGDVTGVSDLMTGRESPSDPSAPASKTIALLQASGVNIKDYIRTMLPSFNIFVEYILQLYYQMSQEGRKYRVRRKSESVTGTDPFGPISRDEMIAKTSIQARAASFVFDKANEKTEAMAAYQLLNTNPYAMQQPLILFKSLKLVLTTMGKAWKNLSDTTLLSPEDFKKQQEAIAMKAIHMMAQQMQQQAEVTGVAPEPTLEDAAGAVTQAQQIAYNPALAQPAESA